ncbi:hypothetical protein [Thiomicrorhabdus aquaedulcis]|uniref:hypothetical protein n=1 Tax=Thiomicrorhabdus aquaedulcis TaxID=2211106 RepID=UPI000FDAC2A6|nr:hypothetical protein [Thiomicrorhabdus aquaedulcis]
MIEITLEQAQEMIGNDVPLEAKHYSGGAKSAYRYQTTTGCIFKFLSGEDAICFYIENEDVAGGSLTDLISTFILNLPYEERELESYRWGLETPCEATSNSFGEYRVLITDAAGGLDWLKKDGQVMMFKNLGSAREACALKDIIQYNPIVI